MTVIDQHGRLTEWSYPYDPAGNPRQLALHECQAMEVLFGGASGPGKTDALIATGVLLCQVIPNVKVIMFRRTYKQLEMEIIPRMLSRIPSEIAKYSSSDHVFTFTNGATFRLGYLDGAMDIYNYQGVEVQLVMFDELTQFNRSQYVFMRSRLRMAGQVAKDMRENGWLPRIVSSTNPGGIGHGWVKAMYIDPSPGPDIPFMGGIEPGESPRGLRPMCYIPARATDNPHLDIEAYLANLEALDPVLRRAYMDGDWDILEGVRFPQFRRGIHVIEPSQLPIPAVGYARAVGVDYGLSAPFCALWGAKIGDTVVVYRELYGANLTAEQQAALIIEAEGVGERAPDRPIPVALDPSCWIRASNQVEKPVDPSLPAVGSIAYYYRQRLGYALKKAKNDRVQGWHLVDHHLNTRADNHLPRLLIYSTCPNLIRVLPELQRDPRHPEDILSYPKQEDHPADTLRYLLQELVGTAVAMKTHDTGYYLGQIQEQQYASDLMVDHIAQVERPSRHAPTRRLPSRQGGRVTGFTDN